MKNIFKTAESIRENLGIISTQEDADRLLDILDDIEEVLYNKFYPEEEVKNIVATFPSGLDWKRIGWEVVNYLATLVLDPISILYRAVFIITKTKFDFDKPKWWYIPYKYIVRILAKTTMRCI